MRVVSRVRRGTGRPDESGAIAVLTAVLALALLVVAALTVDVGNSWAVRGRLQQQADAAAVYAADALPITTTGPTASSSQQAVAKRVAFQIACAPVRGQQQLNASIPACPSSPTSVTLDAYAATLRTNGNVTFPTPTQVKVIAPAARVSYGFGRAAGAEGVDEVRTATARIYTPGPGVPVALSLQCVLSAAGTAPLGLGDLATGTIPLNYISAGLLGPNSTTEPDPATTIASMQAEHPGLAGNTLGVLVPNSTTQGTVAAPISTLQISGLTAPAAGTVVLRYYRGTQRFDADPVVYAAGVGLLSPIPAGVRDTAGTWYVKAHVIPTIGADRWTTNYQAFTVNQPAGISSLTACATMVDSPRRDTGNVVGAPGALRRNIKEGLDHPLGRHPSLVTLAPPASPTVGNVLGVLNGGLLDCGAAPGSVLDDDAARVTPANCARIATDGARATEFTEGFLASPSGSGSYVGRLSCAADPTGCAHGSFAIPGLPGTYNNDTLADFTAQPSLLSSSLFWGLSTYLTDGVPVLTPPSTALSPAIYRSPRFMWAAIVSRVAGSTTCSQCPVLTFRPVFITQSQPSGIAALDELTTQLGNLVGGVLATLLGTVFPWLNPTATSNDHGVVMKGTALSALRFQTIEPTALPVPPLDYDGPVSDYLGVGPKVIRLVR